MLTLLIAAGLYQALALFACWRHGRRRDPLSTAMPAVSILKPVRGTDPHFAAAIRTHAALDYPEYEILFGVRDENDPAVAEIKKLQREFPQRSIRLIYSTADALNGKVGVLIDLARAARHNILVVNDSDISVPPDYLRRLTPPLADPAIGLVTCLYSAAADTFPSRMEALGIATDFVPGVLVAPLFGVTEFGLGSTLALRRDALERLGGFRAVADYVADDFQLGKQLAALGYRNHLLNLTVSTSVKGGTWQSVWLHQIRWARTIRVSHGAGYLGLPITYAGLWVLTALITGHWAGALALLTGRYMAATAAAVGVLQTKRDLWLAPLRDVLALPVWCVALLGRDVVWRDRILKLTSDGRIRPASLDTQPANGYPDIVI